MKIYDNKKTGLSTISGKIESISDDMLNLTVKTQVYDAATKTRNDTSVPVSLESTFEENASVGQNITVVGFKNPRTKSYDAMFVSTGSGSFDYDALSVVSGDVIFAGYNEEKNEDGSVKMSREYTTASGEVVAPHAKKPHFDIGIATIEPDPSSDKEGATRRVTHIVKVYARKDKDGNIDSSSVETVKKLFNNYNYKENPAHVTIVTAPGQEFTRETVGKDGRTYINPTVNHLGYRSLDVEYTKAKVAAKTAETKTEASAPAPAVKEDKAEEVPAGAGTGFDAVPTEEEVGNDIENYFV